MPERGIQASVELLTEREEVGHGVSHAPQLIQIP